MYHIIANPTAGDRKVKRNIKRLMKVFTDARVDFTMHETRYRGAARDIAEELTKEDGMQIVVVGGDGTVHEVLNGIRNPETCTLGIIPLGTGNDFATAAGIPSNAEKAAKLILNGTAKETNYLEVGGVRCMNVGGLGIDVDVLVRCNKGKGRGKLKYLQSLIVSFFKFDGYNVSVECAGERFEMKALIVAACNGQMFGGGLKICPAANLDDDKLDVMAVECFKSKWSILKAFLMLIAGKIMKYKYKKHFVCDSVKIETEEPCVVQLDGELYENLQFDAKVCHGLKMYR
jgi:YegS/Rv2252/BmrU family lipid kinase